MDFKIGDEIEEKAKSPKKANNHFPLIIVGIISVAIGVTVFLVSNAIFGGSKKEPTSQTETNLKLTDENVKILYDYVTYGVKGTRNNKFIKEPSIKLENFSNYEKFYYALQFAQVEDFADTKEVNSNNEKIYNISSSKIKTYMQRFFGDEVTYSTSSKITYPFSFRINNNNVGTLEYNISRDGFDTIFSSLEEDIIDKSPIKPYYTELVNANKKSDGSIELTEKIIYTTTKDNQSYIDISIYKDFEKTMLLESRKNQTLASLQEKPISIKDYQEKSATITYTFKLNSHNYYFYSSTIKN